MARMVELPGCQPWSAASRSTGGSRRCWPTTSTTTSCRASPSTATSAFFVANQLLVRGDAESGVRSRLERFGARRSRGTFRLTRPGLGSPKGAEGPILRLRRPRHPRPRSCPRRQRRGAGRRAGVAAAGSGRAEPPRDGAAAADGLARRRSRTRARRAPSAPVTAAGGRGRDHAWPSSTRAGRAGCRATWTGSAPAPTTRPRPARSTSRDVRCATSTTSTTTETATSTSKPGTGCSSPGSSGAWHRRPSWCSSRRSTATAWAPSSAWPGPIRAATARKVDLINLSLGFYTVLDATPPASRPRWPMPSMPASPSWPRPATTPCPPRPIPRSSRG